MVTRKKLIYFFIASLVAVNVLVWYAVFYLENHRNLFLYFFDVGQGDAIFIQAPNFNQVLIDGGSNEAVLSKLSRVMPFWDRSIDLLVLTHPHADHLDGLLEVVRRYQIEAVLETGVSHSIPEYEEWRKLLKDKGVKVFVARAGLEFRLADQTYFDVLSPTEDFRGKSLKNIHDAVIVVKLIYASTSALLMGDAEKSLEYHLTSSGLGLKSDVLKIGHHGSKTSTSDELLRVVSPQLAVIQVGRKNRYGHPYQEVLDRLARVGIKILRTDLDGDIDLSSNGVEFYLLNK